MDVMTFRYDFAPTPFGDALAVFSDEGIVRFDLSESDDPSVPWLLESVSGQLRRRARAGPRRRRRAGAPPRRLLRR